MDRDRLKVEEFILSFDFIRAWDLVKCQVVHSIVISLSLSDTIHFDCCVSSLELIESENLATQGPSKDSDAWYGCLLPWHHSQL